MLTQQRSQRRRDLLVTQSRPARGHDVRHAELKRPTRRTTAADHLGVQTLATVTDERAIRRPDIKAALSEPRLKLERDALLAPRRLLRAPLHHLRSDAVTPALARDGRHILARCRPPPHS